MEKSITKLTFEDLKNFCDFNTEVIYEIFKQFKFCDEESDKKVIEPLIQDILNEMKLVIPSIAILRQNQPTRFMMSLIEEILKASENAKRKNSYHGNIEQDIKRTRESVENYLAQTYKTETILFCLLKSKQFSQALTMVEALEIERSKDDLVLQVEVLNWKLELMSKLGDDNGFFETLNKVLTITDGKEMRYDEKEFKVAIEYILMKKFNKGIPFSLNIYGVEQAKKDIFLAQKTGEGFQELLVYKTLDAILKKRIIDSSYSFNQFLKNEWSNIVESFHLINPYVGEIPRPNF